MRRKVKCAKCADVIDSTNQKDMKYCSCKSIWIDCSDEYMRCGGDYQDFVWLDESGNEIPKVTQIVKEIPKIKATEVQKLKEKEGWVYRPSLSAEEQLELVEEQIMCLTKMNWDDKFCERLTAIDKLAILYLIQGVLCLLVPRKETL